ncbi:MAG: hypothetical protein IT208_00060 [Chthonomonadales bacterium]|nr:hypothetical protein [Chthonomonadales bacterium]
MCLLALSLLASSAAAVTCARSVARSLSWTTCPTVAPEARPARSRARASRSRGYITPEQAVQAVRDFWDDPTIEGTVSRLYEDDPLGPCGVFFDVVVGDSVHAGTYSVRATDGAVMSADFPCPDDYDAGLSPTLTLEQAQAIAERFLLEHYPPFAQGVWQRLPEYMIRNDWQYGFAWYPVLNAYGVLGPFDVRVEVDGVTGQVRRFLRPRERITGPTVPQVTMEQARQVAVLHCCYDPALVPFTEVRLELIEDKGSTQTLKWTFWQQPDLPDDPWFRCAISVNAVTGEFWQHEYPLGGGIGPKAPPNPNRYRRHGPRVRSGPGAPRQVETPDYTDLRIEGGRAWCRMAAFHVFGAEARVEDGEVRVRARGHEVLGAQVGARRLAGGWWLPLRRTARALGWQVDWLPATKEAPLMPSMERAAATPRRSTPSAR